MPVCEVKLPIVNRSVDCLTAAAFSGALNIEKTVRNPG